jgi:hypothetical protein
MAKWVADMQNLLEKQMKEFEETMRAEYAEKYRRLIQETRDDLKKEVAEKIDLRFASLEMSITGPHVISPARHQMVLHEEESESSMPSPISDGDSFIDYDQDSGEASFQLSPRQTRKRTRTKLFVPGGSSDEGPDEDLMLGESDSGEAANAFSEADKDACAIFLRRLADTPFRQVIDKDYWYQKRYGVLLAAVCANLGRQGKNTTAILIWNQVMEDSFDSNAPTPIVQKRWCGDKDMLLMTTCCLCNTKKPCAEELWVRGAAHPIAKNCAQLASRVIEFFSGLHWCVNFTGIDPAVAINTLDTAMAAIQTAHAGKRQF